MATIQHLFSYLLHIDTSLIAFIRAYGVWTYFILFSIIFCETGLIITPFLPGDSLIFAAGSLAAHTDQPLSLQLLLVLLILASALGNKLNYLIGRAIGPRIFAYENSWLLNKKPLMEAHQFYEKHGGKTIVIARFMPILRTFAPFIAGVGYMSLTRFSFYNLISAALWITSLLFLGYFFGHLPIVRNHFTIAVYSIILLSLIPPIGAFLYKKLSTSTDNL